VTHTRRPPGLPFCGRTPAILKTPTTRPKKVERGPHTQGPFSMRASHALGVEVRHGRKLKRWIRKQTASNFEGDVLQDFRRINVNLARKVAGKNKISHFPWMFQKKCLCQKKKKRKKTQTKKHINKFHSPNS